MNSNPNNGSDINGHLSGAEFLKLAHELDIPEYLLETALDDAARLMRQSPPNVRPANKQALRGIADSLCGIIEKLSTAEVRERLATAVFEDPGNKDTDDCALYYAWSDARDRVDRTIEDLRGVLAMVKRGEAITLPSGRPLQDRRMVAIRSLLWVWTEELHRKVTISGHRSDGREVRPSPTLRFIHESMRLIGEEIPEQTCRSMLQDLQTESKASGTKPWANLDQ